MRAPFLLKEMNPVLRSLCTVEAALTLLLPITGLLYLSELSALSIPVTIMTFNPQCDSFNLGIAFLQLSSHCYIFLGFFV